MQSAVACDFEVFLLFFLQTACGYSAGDRVFVSGGECDPHHVPASGGKPATTYWHYPKITLLGSLSLKADGAAGGSSE